MSDNKCAACGQFSGKGHKCPTVLGAVKPPVAPVVHESMARSAAAEAKWRAGVQDRVAAAQAAMTAAAPAPDSDPVPECGCGFDAERGHEEDRLSTPIPFTPVCGRNCTLSHCCNACAEDYVDREIAHYDRGWTSVGWTDRMRNPVSYQGNVTATFATLREKLGEPDYGGDKSTAEWHLNVETPNGTRTVSIYDYHSSGVGDFEYDWHIGGEDEEAVNAVSRILDMPTSTPRSRRTALPVAD